MNTELLSERCDFVRWLGFRDIAFYLILLIASLVMENVGLGLLIPIIGALEEGGSRSVLSFGSISIDAHIGWLVALLMVIMAFRMCLSLTTVWFGSWVTNGWNERMRVQLHDALHDSTIAEPLSLRSGELINTIMGETWAASEYCRAQLGLVSRALAVAVYGSVLVWLSWKMTAVLFITALPLAFFAYRINRRTRRISRTMRDLNNDLYQTAVGSVGAQFTIAVYGLEQRFRSTFAEKSSKLRAQIVKAQVYGSIVPQLLSFVAVPVVAGLVLYARGQSMPVGEIIVFVLILFRALPQGSGVLSGLAELARHRAGIEIVVSRLKSWVPHAQLESRRDLTQIEQIEFKQVSFSYESSEPIMDDFSTKLIAGNVYRLHGASGAGKSTLVSLILGLLRPNSGEIEVNGIPLDEIHPANLRGQVGYAGQRTSIFETSIGENIELWRPLDIDRLRDIEKTLGLDDIAAALPDGRLTRIGTGGVVISGGQLQRVGIARAIAGTPSLVVLDEATSELDLDAERKVMSAVRKLCPDSILLTISHRVESDGQGKSLWIERCS